MNVSITKNSRKKSAELESTSVPRHNYWTNRRRYSFSSTQVRFL